MLLALKVVGYLAVATIDSGFGAGLEVLRNLLVGYPFSTLALDGTVRTGLKMLQSIIILKNALARMRLVVRCDSVLLQERTLELLHLQLLLRKSVHWQELGLRASNWALVLISICILLHPLLYAFVAKSCLAFLTFDWV